MPTLGGWELILVLLVVVLLFGAKRLPDASRSLGRSMRIFKAETRGMAEDDQRARSQTTAEVTDRRPSADEIGVERVEAPVDVEGTSGRTSGGDHR